jgi:hypothetical protein
MAVKLQIRRGTSTEWGASTAILAAGELVWASDTRQFKVGDGTKTWAQLEYVAGPTGAAGPGIASGGTNGQILSKVGTGTGTDYQTSWTSNFVSSVNGATGAITGLATVANPTFTGTLTLPSVVNAANINSGSPFKYLAVNSLGGLVVGSSPSSTATSSTLALRDSNSNLFATTFSGTSVQFTGTGFSQTILPTATTVTGGNHSFYLPQLASSPYSATIITNADSKTVSTNMLADYGVTTIKLADNSVTSDKIVNGTITNEDISAGAGIAISKLAASSMTINSSLVTLGGTYLITATPTDATVTDAKIATTLSPSKITGTAVITTDSRLSDNRTPTDGSVTDSKISGTLSPSKITGTAATLSAANTFAAGAGITPITIKGYDGLSNLQEWWSVASTSTAPAAWVKGGGLIGSESGLRVGFPLSTVIQGDPGVVTVKATSSTPGIVIKYAGANAFEIHDSTGAPVFQMDATAKVKAPSSTVTPLTVIDTGVPATRTTFTSASFTYSDTATAPVITLTGTGAVPTVNSFITFSNFTDTALLPLNNSTLQVKSVTVITGTVTITVSWSGLENISVTNQNGYGDVSSLGVSLQKWQLTSGTGAITTATEVDSSGNLRSNTFKSVGVITLASASGGAGYAASTADFIGRSLGMYSTTAKNQIYGPTTIGYGTGAAPLSSQYGVLQVTRTTTNTSTLSPVMSVRTAANQSGVLQSWLQGTTAVGALYADGSFNTSLSITSPTITGSTTVKVDDNNKITNTGVTAVGAIINGAITLNNSSGVATGGTLTATGVISSSSAISVNNTLTNVTDAYLLQKSFNNALVDTNGATRRLVSSGTTPLVVGNSFTFGTTVSQVSKLYLDTRVIISAFNPETTENNNGDWIEGYITNKSVGVYDASPATLTVFVTSVGERVGTHNTQLYLTALEFSSNESVINGTLYANDIKSKGAITAPSVNGSPSIEVPNSYYLRSPGTIASLTPFGNTGYVYYTPIDISVPTKVTSLTLSLESENTTTGSIRLAIFKTGSSGLPSASIGEFVISSISSTPSANISAQLTPGRYWIATLIKPTGTTITPNPPAGPYYFNLVSVSTDVSNFVGVQFGSTLGNCFSTMQSIRSGNTGTAIPSAVGDGTSYPLTFTTLTATPAVALRVEASE